MSGSGPSEINHVNALFTYYIGRTLLRRKNQYMGCCRFRFHSHFVLHPAKLRFFVHLLLPLFDVRTTGDSGRRQPCSPSSQSPTKFETWNLADGASRGRSRRSHNLLKQFDSLHRTKLAKWSKLLFTKNCRLQSY